MNLYFARHGPNDLGGEEYLDRERSLIPRGIKHVAAVAMQMKKDGEQPKAIFASTFRRTLETADIFGRVLDVRVIPVSDLCPERSLHHFVHSLLEHERSGMMLVGHHMNMAAFLADCGDGLAPEVLACGEVRRYSCQMDRIQKLELSYRVTPYQVGMLDQVTLKEALSVR